MKRLIAGFVSVAFVLVSFSVATASITYNLLDYPSDENGCTLTGSITTDGTIGPISVNNILSWTFTITDGNQSETYVNGYDNYLFYGNQGYIPFCNSVSTTQTQLIITATNSPNGNELWLNSPNNGELYWVPEVSNGQAELVYVGYANLSSSYFGWDTWSPMGSTYSSWVIAQTATVPEPPTLIVWSLLGAIGSVGWWRCRDFRRAEK